MKNKCVLWCLWVGGGLAILFGIVVAIFFFMAVRPSRQLMDVEMSKSHVEPPELRQICHRVISTPFGNCHDAFLALVKCGNYSSVPYLLRALRWQTPPQKDGFTDCQTGHCIEALEAITGQTFGYNPDQWDKWWKENRAWLENRSSRTPHQVVEDSFTGQFVSKYVRPLSDPVAKLAHKDAYLPPELLASSRVILVEVGAEKGGRRTVFKDETRRPPSDGMTTGVGGAQNVGLYYPVTLDQHEIEVRVNYHCDIDHGFVAVHLAVPPPLLLPKPE